MRVFYRLDGSQPDPVETYETPGWRGIGPVVTGNRSDGQLQLNIFADLFDTVRLYVDGGHVLDTETGYLLTTFADQACDAWRLRDAGMWELERLEHYTSSKIGCWQALRCAVHLAEPGSDQLDASLLLHAGSGFDQGPRMSSAIDALFEKLSSGPLLYRFSGAREQEEGAFVACGFWAVSALHHVGRTDEARTLMDRLVAMTNDVGMLAEMIDPRDNAFLGNLPQGLSHLTLIGAALDLAS